MATIRGTITYDDGESVEFEVGPYQDMEVRYSQWGNSQRVLGRGVKLMEALVGAQLEAGAES